MAKAASLIFLCSILIGSIDANANFCNRVAQMWQGDTRHYMEIPVRPFIRKAMDTFNIPTNEKIKTGHGWHYYEKDFALSYDVTSVRFIYDSAKITADEIQAIIKYASQFATGDMEYQRWTRLIKKKQKGTVISAELRTKYSYLEMEWEREMTAELDKIFRSIVFP